MAARFKSSRRGNTASIFALLVPALMGSVAMGVDWGAISVARLQVQSAADAAAIAATTQMDDATVAETLAEAYANRVMVNGVQPQVTDFAYGVWDGDNQIFVPGDVPAKNALRVRTSATIPMYFSAIFGLTEVTVTGEAGAGPAVVPNRAPDHVTVVDNTCSMNAFEVQQEREAVEALLDCVNNRSAPESRGGIVTFGGVDYTWSPIVEYGDHFDDLQTAAANIQRCGTLTPCTNTNQASGLAAGLALLDAVDATRPDDVGQVILLMSDGEPVRYPICQTSFYLLESTGEVQFPVYDACQSVAGGWYNEVYYAHLPQVSDITAWAQAGRAAALAADIEIYTVYYGSNSTGNAWLRDNVTTDPLELHFQTLAATDIPDTFVDICVAFTGGSAGMLW